MIYMLLVLYSIVLVLYKPEKSESGQIIPD